MRILHVNKFLYRRGGAESYMLDLAQLQAEAGHTVEYFAMKHPDNIRSRYERLFPPHVELEPMPESLLGKVEGAEAVELDRLDPRHGVGGERVAPPVVAAGV